MSADDRVIRAVAAAELAVVVAVAPALLFPSSSRLLVALAVPVVWLANWKTGKGLIPSTPLNASLFVLAAMVGVSLFATYDVGVSLGKVSGIMLGLCVFWAVTRWVDTPRRLRVAVEVFVLAGSALAAAGLLGMDWAEKFPLFSATIARFPRAIRGVPGAAEGFQPNAVGGCLLLFIPLQIALLIDRGRSGFEHRPRTRNATVRDVAQVLLLLLTAGTLVLTQSREAWFGLLVAAMAVLSWQSRNARRLALVAAGAMLIVAATAGQERVMHFAISRSGPGMADDIAGRLELWSRAVSGIRDFPFTGMGMNAFRKLVPVLYPTILTSPTIDISHAHNHLLQAALDLGIPGLVAYLSIWIVAAIVLIHVYRQSETRCYRTIAAGLGAGLIAHFTFGMTDAIALGAKVGVLFWLVLAMTVALHRVAIRPPLTSLQPPGPGRTPPAPR